MTRSRWLVVAATAMASFGLSLDSPARGDDGDASAPLGSRTITLRPIEPTRDNASGTLRPNRRLRREQNRYFAMRPNYAPAPRGARANVTFAPFTSKYYPEPDTYYPPLPVPPQQARPR